MAFQPREYLINLSSNTSSDSKRAEVVVINAFLDDNAKVVSKSLLEPFFSKLEKGISKKGRTKLQRLKDLGLLGAIQDSEVTSMNYKKYIDEHFDK